MIDTKKEKAQFEGFILNNRYDDPKNGSICKDKLTDTYIDPRLNLAWEAWKEAKLEVMEEAVQLREVTDIKSKFKAGGGLVTIYQGMSDELILKVIKKTLSKAEGAPFVIQQTPDWNR